MRVFLGNNCSFSRLITKHDNVLLQFTTARFITNYDNLLLQFKITWLLRFSTTYNLRRLLLHFTTGNGYEVTTEQTPRLLNERDILCFNPI